MKKPQLEAKETLTTFEAMELFGLSKRKFEKFIAAGKCDAFIVYYNTRKLILRAAFSGYLDTHHEIREELLNNGRQKNKA